MIKSNKGKFTARGKGADLMADFSVLVHAFYEEVLTPKLGAEGARQYILDIADVMTSSEDELEKKMLARLVNMAERATAAVKERVEQHIKEGNE